MHSWIGGRKDAPELGAFFLWSGGTGFRWNGQKRELTPARLQGGTVSTTDNPMKLEATVGYVPLWS